MSRATRPRPTPSTWLRRWRWRGRHGTRGRCRSEPSFSVRVVRCWEHAAMPRSPPGMLRPMRKSVCCGKPGGWQETTGFQARRCMSLWSPARCAQARCCRPGSHASYSVRPTHAPVRAAVLWIYCGTAAGTIGSMWWGVSWPRSAGRCYGHFSLCGDPLVNPPQRRRAHRSSRPLSSTSEFRSSAGRCPRNEPVPSHAHNPGIRAGTNRDR